MKRIWAPSVRAMFKLKAFISLRLFTCVVKLMWLKCLCSSGVWPPAVVWRRRARLLPAGRPHLVQELQRSPHPGPVGQNLHRLLTLWHKPNTSRTARLCFLQTVSPFLFISINWERRSWKKVGMQSEHVAAVFPFNVFPTVTFTTCIFGTSLIMFLSISTTLTCRQLGLRFPRLHSGTDHISLYWHNQAERLQFLKLNTDFYFLFFQFHFWTQ